MTVALFRAPLDLDPRLQRSLAATLSAEELTRAGALLAPATRARWIADHGWRRRLLAARLGCSPAELTFTRGEDGKLRLGDGGPHFSASRSEDLAWYAVSDEVEVGVDIEHVDGARTLEPLARRLLSARERAIYETIPATARHAALYDCWTCKEAAVKARGSGLVFPLTALEVWSGDGAPMRCDELEIRQLAPGGGLAGALAVRIGAAEEAAITSVVDLASP